MLTGVIVIVVLAVFTLLHDIIHFAAVAHEVEANPRAIMRGLALFAIALIAGVLAQDIYDQQHEELPAPPAERTDP